MEVNHMIFYICHFLLSSSSSIFFQNSNVRIMSWSPTCYYFGILDRQFKSEIEKDKIALHGWWQYYVTNHFYDVQMMCLRPSSP